MNSFCSSSCSSTANVRDKVSVTKTVSFDDIQTESRIEIVRNDPKDGRNSNPRSQTDLIADDSMFVDDFVIELPTSFQFKLQAVDHAKLLVIRDKKIEKKKNRLFEKMGLPSANDMTIRRKKIFLSQSANRPDNNSNDAVYSKGKCDRTP